MDSVTLVNRLLKCGAAFPETIVPCTPEEVQYIEDWISTRLPAEYRAFLLAIGKCAGRFMSDVDIFYPEILRNRDEAIEKLDNWESGVLALPADAFVFGFRPAEQFWYFRCQNDIATDVFWYFEGRGKFERLSMSFWDFIEVNLTALEAHMSSYSERNEWWYRFHNEALKRACRVRELGIPPSL